MLHAMDVEPGETFTFTPVKGDPRTETYKVVRQEDDYTIVKRVVGGIVSEMEERFNQYAMVA